MANNMMMMGCGVTGTTTVAVNTNASQFTAATSEYLSRADEALLSTGDIDFNVGCWVYLDSKTAFRELITKYNVAGSREYVLEYSSTSDRFQFLVYDGTAAIGTAVANTLGIPATATWYFVQGFHDSVANTVGISVNNGTVDSVTTGAGVPIDTTAGFLIGAVISGAPTLFHDGRMQSAFFAKSKLSTTVITSLYNAGVPKGWCQLIGAEQALFTGWWDLGEASGSRADSTANALTLTDNNTVTGNPGSRSGNCL